MRRMSPLELDRLGTTAVALIVARDLGWVFREQPLYDYGVDPLVEVVDDGLVTGNRKRTYPQFRGTRLRNPGKLDAVDPQDAGVQQPTGLL